MQDAMHQGFSGKRKTGTDCYEMRSSCLQNAIRACEVQIGRNEKGLP
jgi:hypothetical protein